jgi:hypothetical protein
MGMGMITHMIMRRRMITMITRMASIAITLRTKARGMAITITLTMM